MRGWTRDRAQVGEQRRAPCAARAAPAPAAPAPRVPTSGRRPRRAARRRRRGRARAVSGGSGAPVRVDGGAADQRLAAARSSCPYGAPTARRTRTACAVTSGPMPSPGRTAISARITRLASRSARSRLSCASRKPSSSTPFEQAVAREGIDGERRARRRRRGRACCDSRSIVTSAPGLASEQLGASAGSTTTGTSPFLSALFRKMSAIERADHGAEAVVDQRPRRVLARRAAAEVVAGDQHLARRAPPGG